MVEEFTERTTKVVYRRYNVDDRPPKTTNGIPNPPGYVIVHGQVQKVIPLQQYEKLMKRKQEEPVDKEQQDNLKVKKAWEIAIAPAKSYD